MAIDSSEKRDVKNALLSLNILNTWGVLLEQWTINGVTTLRNVLSIVVKVYHLSENRGIVVYCDNCLLRNVLSIVVMVYHLS